jgi:hypothetical protein
MPYIIHVPGVPRPYITNDPRIFMDARSFDWHCESRPYSDSFCKIVRREEDARYESDRRTAHLEQYWVVESIRNKKPATTKSTATVKIPIKHARHAKHDSVHGIVVEVQELRLDIEDLFA